MKITKKEAVVKVVEPEKYVVELSAEELIAITMLLGEASEGTMEELKNSYCKEVFPVNNISDRITYGLYSAFYDAAPKVNNEV